MAIHTTLRRQRLSRPIQMFFDNENPTNAVLHYEPAGNTARVSVYPALGTGFPDTANITLEITNGKKSPGSSIFSNGFAAWYEIENKPRCFFVIFANGEYFKSSSTEEPSGSQVLTVQCDAAGGVESVKVHVASTNEALPYIVAAANLYRWGKDAKPISEAKTTLLPIDSRKMNHEFQAILTAPGGMKLQHVGNVSEIRAAGFNPDSFKFWRSASLWQISDKGSAIVAQSVLGDWHIGVYNSSNVQVATEKTKEFNTALNIASQMVGYGN